MQKDSNVTNIFQLKCNAFCTLQKDKDEACIHEKCISY